MSFKGLFGEKFRENWKSTGDRTGLADKIGVLGVGVSQLAAGQAPNIMPVWQAIEDRRMQRKLGEAMGNPELLAGFTPEQQKMLSVMPPEMAQSLIMEKIFAPPPSPEYREFGGDLYDMNASGGPAVVLDGMSGAEIEGQEAAAERARRAADAEMLGYSPGSPEYNQYIVTGEMADANQATYGTTLQFWTDESGKTRAGVLGNDGNLKEVPPPGGGDWALGVEKIDLGTKWQIRDKRTGAVLGEEIKDLRGEEAEKVAGKAEGEAAVAAPGDVATADTTLAYIESLRNHPGREAGTGLDSFRSAIPGTDARDFAIENKRLASGAFMTAIEQLRGMGALSNAEGQTATAAVAALEAAGTEEGYLKRLAEYEEIVKRGRERAVKRIKHDGTPMSAPEPQTGGLSEDDLKYLEAD